uniref:FIT family protein n=1 Tax=Steinernema glaseri TaxID=37863 RepID=A0A1I8A8H1_9BILA
MTMASTKPPANRRILAGPTTTTDVISGVTIQLGRRYLFIDAHKKAYAYLLAVFLLSVVSVFVDLPKDFYFMRKNNVFNLYGTKIGWFWTWVTVGPFIYLATLFQTKNKHSAVLHLTRLVVATFLWYFFTSSFVSIEQKSGTCNGAKGAFSRSECKLQGGRWSHGYDISGHCFLMIYSILIICEEAIAFRKWPEYSGQGDARSIEQYRKSTLLVRSFFVAMLALHLLWDFQLVMTVLYYHTFLDKILGALCATLCWFGTYRVLFPTISLMPVNRLPETASPRRH